LAELIKEVTTKFKNLYHSEPAAVSRAPGRANLIGEHTDYNSGFVFPLAINREIVIAAAERNDKKVSLYSLDFTEQAEFNLPSISYDSHYLWSNYFRGVAFYFLQKGYPLKGMDVAIKGNIPVGAGLSSSAAFEVATAFLLKKINHIEIADIELIKLCQQAENEFVGVKCGIMDQFASCLAQKGKAILLDCRDLSYKYINIPENITIAICDTGVKRELANSEYNRRRNECEEAVSALKQALPNISSLREVSMAELEQNESLLNPIALKRSRHVISENNRVLQAVESLKKKDLQYMGQLMYESHRSLREDYEVSCAELDALVEIAQKCKFTLGARMMGAGFGGCTINLVKSEGADIFKKEVEQHYRTILGYAPKIYILSTTNGAAF